MQVKTFSFTVNTVGINDIVDITNDVQKILNDAGMSEGNVLIFVPGSTAGITTIEYETGLLKDYPEFFEKIIPVGQKYHHDEAWNDSNGYAHIRASLQGASLTVPFAAAKLLLGTWQQIILVDFDNRERKRKIITQLIGQ